MNGNARALAKYRLSEINTGKVKGWTPMDRDNSLTFIGAFEEGYAQAVKDLEKKGKEKPE